MKRFLIGIVLFFAFVAVADYAFGVVCRSLEKHARGGETANLSHIIDGTTDSVLVLGSSRALHHYDPAILEDSLGTTVYNCGSDGNGIVYLYGMLANILDRHTPAAIVYDATIQFDISENDNARYLKPLRRWYGRNASADSLFAEVSATEALKMNSALYRYNYIFVQMLSDNLSPRQAYGYKGFKPFAGAMDYEPGRYPDELHEWDPLKLRYFNRLIDQCRQRGIKLVVVFSPYLGFDSSRPYTRLRELCDSRHVPVIDMFCDTAYTSCPELFYDPSHLNDVGAEIFTRDVAGKLREAFAGQ